MSQSRILFVNPSADMGGAEVSLFTLLNGLDPTRFHRTVLVPAEGPLVGRVQVIGCNVVLAAAHPMSLERQLVRSLKNSLFAAAEIPRLTALLNELRPDLVHINSYRMGVPFTLAARRLQIPTIWHLRDIPESSAKRHLLARLARMPDRAIAISQAVAQALGSEKFTNMVVIHNGVDMDLFDNLTPGAFRAELGLSQETVLLCTIGQLIPLKGHDLLLRSFARLKDDPKLHLAIVGGKVISNWFDEAGTESYIQTLHHLVATNGLSDRVTFTGPRSDVPQILSDSDLYVHATTSTEAFGRVLIEAMAARKPVIAPDWGGIREIVVPDETGLLFARGDEADLTEKLTTLIAQRQRWASMGEAGFKRAVKRFSATQYVSSVAALYQDLLAKRP